MASYEDDHNVKIKPNVPEPHRTLASTLQPGNSLLSGSDVHSLIATLAALSDGSTPAGQFILSQLHDFEDSEPASGVSQQFLDSLERVDKKQLKPSDTCPICATAYLDDKYPLVVHLPCDRRHMFDLDCIGPWLKLHSTCPICRKDVTAKKVVDIPDDEEEEEGWDMYG